MILKLARRSGSVKPHRVWCWEDAWKVVASSHARPPAKLSTIGRITVLAEAIEQARRARQLDLIDRAVEWPGFRRELARRFASWTVEERVPSSTPPTDGSVDREQWAIFGHYRAILERIEAEDDEGFAVWASRSLLRKRPPELSRPGEVYVLDPRSPTRADWRLLESLQLRAKSMTVTLPYEPEDSLTELYAEIARTRQLFLDWGFVEEPERPVGLFRRPPGMDYIERELFRSDGSTRAPLNRAGDLKILGGPKGEGLGLLIAREVNNWIEEGVPPDDILVLVPRLDEDAERIREALASWGVPVSDRDQRKLSNLPAISALRLVMRLPIEQWETSLLVRLLRNGQIRWTGGHLASTFGPFEAASAIRATRVFRDHETLRNALASGLDRKPKDPAILAALDSLERLAGWINPIAKPGPWRLQIGRLFQLARNLGLDLVELQPLRDALEDRGWVLDALGPSISEESSSWEAFANLVDLLVSHAENPPMPARPGTIRIVNVEEAEGVRASCIILANLDERTFPSPRSIDLEAATEPESGGSSLAYSREMLRFARVAGSTDDRLVLAYPMTDQNGEALLPSGFLDDLIRRMDATSRDSILEKYPRFDPVLAGHEDLARSPSDARVLAIARACANQDLDSIRRMAGQASHIEALQGTADAFSVAGRRRDDREFGPYDGRLRDPSAIVRIAADFGPNHAFSPSQLESFALCPFQFYQRYVLGLKVVDERRELDEDYAGRGSHVHDVLEQIHQQIAVEGASDLIERLGVLIETDMRVELERHEGAEADVAQVLREIGTLRTNKTLSRYHGQFVNYFGKQGEKVEPHLFEVLFGQPDNEHSKPYLRLGQDGDEVLLQGKIDRIDRVEKDGKLLFRVIDYKTGSSPSGKDVKSGLASQLTLYALAVEQLIFPSGDQQLIDVGYWSLPKNGYKSVKLGDWISHRDELRKFVVALVRQLRGGVFPIDSRKKDCQESCDFRSTCRVVEVRNSGKSWDERPELGGDE
ncbi:PD-(D/E)XK nuclease family protein [Tundrisphaera lichenicola]|uniref:PD-(D/E)XK nuclease family protein n=1 Tax=Tundrisphaera lichenicola TaxID=2029860 RepID=UPI003EBC6320